MRYVLAAIAICASATAGAQPRPAPQPPATVAPPIVLPFPPLMTPPAGGLTQGSPFDPTHLTIPPRDLYRARSQSRRQTRTSLPLAGGWYSGIAEPAASAPAVEPPPAMGSVRLLVTPAKAQVFVDGYYIGTMEDLDARAITVGAWPHRIEFRAPGYQTLTVDVHVARGDTVTYRGALEPSAPPRPERDRPAASTAPIYVIPGCYLGNIPPRPERIPAGCDIRNVHVVGAR